VLANPAMDDGEATYLELPGERVDPGDLRVPKARDVAGLLSTDDLPFCELLECRRVEGNVPAEAVVLEVDVEVGQHPKHDIRRHERVAAVFREDDGAVPEALALRSDFPLVPHINAQSSVGGALPRSLCLYDEAYTEVNLRWTAASFVGRLRDWLARTARGELHADDQPLEPLLLGSPWNLVLPPDLFEDRMEAGPVALGVSAVDDGRGGYTLLAERLGEGQDRSDLQYVAVGLEGEPREHGVVQTPPASLGRLRDYLRDANLELFEELRGRMRSWPRDDRFNALLEERLILVVALPKTRRPSGAVEASEVWAFMSADSVGEVGTRLGIWEAREGHYGVILGGDAPKLLGEDVPLAPLNVGYAFSREQAAALSGLPGEDSSKKIAAVGVGALGSQVFLDLVREGQGDWTLIDHDKLLPHNLARHALIGFEVGFPKAEALAHIANRTVYGDSIASSIVADVLAPGGNADAVRESLAGADVILDASASVPVARHLARDVDSAARRVSLFLNPSGTAGVILREDTDRDSPLDWLEMVYYRALLGDPRLRDHLRRPPGRLRYGRSCRDLSSAIPQELVALHAAIGARSLRVGLGADAAEISAWKTDADGVGVEHIQIPPTEATSQRYGDWTVVTDRWLLDKVAQARLNGLPNETGGVLIGAHDTQRRILYLVDALPSPPDSEEWPTLYVRGSLGLTQRLEEVEEVTDGQLGYAGEWHSHPRGHGPSPSADDRKVFEWLQEHMILEALPATMLIVGEHDCALFVGSIP
jgi:hypothetical protein